MSNTDDGGPAFPHLNPMMRMGDDGKTIERAAPELDGMSLRDWFAGHALAGMNATLTDAANWPQEDGARQMAKYAYLQADAMIAAKRGKLGATPTPAEVELARLRSENTSLKSQLSIRWAMRREVEELLGLNDRDTYDEAKFKAALDRLRRLVSQDQSGADDRTGANKNGSPT